MDYKDKPFEKRKNDCQKIRKKHPHKLPVIVTKEKSSKYKILEKEKYMIPDDITVGQFQAIIRKRLELAPEYSLFFFINGRIMPKQDSLLQDVFERNKNDDGFLYIEYSEERDKGSN
uniref:Autophagy-related protein n=1 Tax=Euplotes harpa TaxID=151035 RepID=A0A7S3JLX0_9SPIT|mmetsp:Transcript_8768/g.9954  ORF Transcript_8768/g.9954 Transcript_8768/m.9954 type:complete len:117 (+) Transcript_8768:44-394(+)